MSVRLGNVTILVRDYDEALKFYTEVLGFEKRSDEKFGPGARWAVRARTFRLFCRNLSPRCKAKRMPAG
jgi:catechol 2,3-dioxygenase-like lactoylglutathione lyase family enzyme